MIDHVELDNVCPPCRAGLHDECMLGFSGELEEGQDCCCNQGYDIDLHLVAVRRRRYVLFDGGEGGTPHEGAPRREEPSAPQRGDSGYIHPDAWPSPQDIGTLTAVDTTGRKRVAKMYPITPGQVCEWARLRYAGGGPIPIVGCLGNPASDLHHGPDKNTLNNAKMSRGVGEAENVHVICSDCHNAWHAANDQFYPPYDRDAQQAEPWLPNFPGEWGPQNDRTEATVEELLEVAAKRENDRRRRGRTTKGRNSAARAEPDTAIADDE